MVPTCLWVRAPLACPVGTTLTFIDVFSFQSFTPMIDTFEVSYKRLTMYAVSSNASANCGTSVSPLESLLVSETLSNEIFVCLAKLRQAALVLLQLSIDALLCCGVNIRIFTLKVKRILLLYCICCWLPVHAKNFMNVFGSPIVGSCSLPRVAKSFSVVASYSKAL